MELYLKNPICRVQLINHYICHDCISNSLFCSDVKFNYITRAIFFDIVLSASTTDCRQHVCASAGSVCCLWAADKEI